MREHFRCVPEIIRFSNDLCYTATPLIPLRQYPPEIGHVVLELMPSQGRINRKELIRNAADVLDFPDVAFKRIDEAIRRLEELKKVCADSNFIWRRSP